MEDVKCFKHLGFNLTKEEADTTVVSSRVNDGGEVLGHRGISGTEAKSGLYRG